MPVHQNEGLGNVSGGAIGTLERSQINMLDVSEGSKLNFGCFFGITRIEKLKIPKV